MPGAPCTKGHDSHLRIRVKRSGNPALRAPRQSVGISCGRLGCRRLVILLAPIFAPCTQVSASGVPLPRRRLGFLPAPRIRRGEIDVGEPERLTGRNRLVVAVSPPAPSRGSAAVRSPQEEIKRMFASGPGRARRARQPRLLPDEDVPAERERLDASAAEALREQGRVHVHERRGITVSVHV
jgi:hypothetical protein